MESLIPTSGSGNRAGKGTGCVQGFWHCLEATAWKARPSDARQASPAWTAILIMAKTLRDVNGGRKVRRASLV